MRLEDMFTTRRRRNDPLDAIAAQIGDLRKQTRHLGRSLTHNAADVAEDLGGVVADWGNEAAKQGAWLAGVATRNALRGARAVQRDPLPLVAVFGTALLLASLLTRRR